MHAECSLEGPACARDFFARGYRHHVRGADTPPCCRRHLGAVLSEVASALDASGVAWFACWGTFLGAVRHGDLIPWDRDADLVVLERDRERVLAALEELERPIHLGFGGAPDVLRVSASASNQIGVDVELWQEADGALVQHGPTGALRLACEDVFPLLRRRFGALTLPTPRRIAVLAQLYGPDCLTQGVRTEQRFGCSTVRIGPDAADVLRQRPTRVMPSLPGATPSSIRSLPR